RSADEPPVSAPSFNLPPRPDRTQGAEDLGAAFGAVRQKLDAILGDSSHRALELKVASAEGIDRAVANLEAEAKRVREHLERNEALAREAEKSAAEARTQEQLQDELESRVNEVQQRAQKLADRG